MNGARFELRLGEPGYPALLARTPHPPPVLFGMGDPAALMPGLAIVGSRKATPYGLGCARMFARETARHGVVVTSGAAIGCDLAAQTAAAEEGGVTVAVLGCGADVDYPARAGAFLARLRSGGGAVVSELPWGSRPRPGQFPARNRIIAGLSAAVLIVEAALPSGTFSTADHALDAGREVWAVPGSIYFSGAAGCNRLLRQGATLVACLDDLRDSLASLDVPAPHRPCDPESRIPPASDRVEDPLLRALLAQPLSPDAVATAVGVPASEALLRIARLEARGAIARYPDGRYGPCAPR